MINTADGPLSSDCGGVFPFAMLLAVFAARSRFAIALELPFPCSSRAALCAGVLCCAVPCRVLCCPIVQKYAEDEEYVSRPPSPCCVSSS
jgi:hypothetical protein